MSGKCKRELPEWDDGHTIVNMDVDGMPWSGPRKRARPAQDAPKDASSRQKEDMTQRESRYFTLGALGAALLVVGVISAAIVLFVLFCQFVWFRR